MFSISKNPKASMAEVLAKAEKYINGEEALISKKESSSTHKEKSGTDKRRGRSPKRQRDRETSPKKDGDRSPKRRGNLRDHLGPPQFERRRRYSLMTRLKRTHKFITAQLPKDYCLIPGNCTIKLVETQKSPIVNIFQFWFWPDILQVHRSTSNKMDISPDIDPTKISEF